MCIRWLVVLAACVTLARSQGVALTVRNGSIVISTPPGGRLIINGVDVLASLDHYSMWAAALVQGSHESTLDRLDSMMDDLYGQMRASESLLVNATGGLAVLAAGSEVRCLSFLLLLPLWTFCLLIPLLC
jgi:hypothetical protein